MARPTNTSKEAVTPESPLDNRYVFGIKGKQQTRDGKYLTDDEGKVRHYKGDISELCGTGMGLEDYEYRILRLTMQSRRYSGPPSPQQTEGYVTKIKVMEKFGHNVKIFEETADYQNHCIDWQLPGTPRDIMWLFKVGEVKDGDEFTEENGQLQCKWVTSKANGTEIVNYRLLITPKTKNDA